MATLRIEVTLLTGSNHRPLRSAARCKEHRAITNDVIAVRDGFFHHDNEPERFNFIKLWTE